jgi:hypothetical protein
VHNYVMKTDGTSLETHTHTHTHTHVYTHTNARATYNGLCDTINVRSVVPGAGLHDCCCSCLAVGASFGTQILVVVAWSAIQHCTWKCSVYFFSLPPALASTSSILQHSIKAAQISNDPPHQSHHHNHTHQESGCGPHLL